MSRLTQSFIRGMSFIGGKKKPLYTLEFLTSTPQHPMGSSVAIVVPYIVIGRASTCAVRFSEAVRTVSRHHAALERRGDDIMVYNLSATNPTLVNGSPVAEAWALRDGDEMQFSYEGPRLRFSNTLSKYPSLKEGTSLGMTKRIGMVVNQSARPYRTVIFSIMGLLVVVALIAGYFLYKLDEETEKLVSETTWLRESNLALNDSLMVAVQANEELKQTMLADKQLIEDRLQTTINQLNDSQQQLAQQLRQTDLGGTVASAIANVKGSVFYMGVKRITVEVEGKTVVEAPLTENCHCTGFLLDDGRFVTARHCIENHYFEKNELNLFITMGGKVTYELFAISSDEKMRFDFTNHDFKVNRTTDHYVREEQHGKTVILRQARGYDGTDWAYVQTDKKGTIQAAPDLSTQLTTGTELHCLGYTYGNLFQAIDSDQGLEVLYSKAIVAKDKLDNNTIVVSGYGFDNGNSGGPLFIVRQGVAEAVAIVSAGYTNPSTGRDDALGSVIPIRNINQQKGR